MVGSYDQFGYREQIVVWILNDFVGMALRGVPLGITHTIVSSLLETGWGYRSYQYPCCIRRNRSLQILLLSWRQMSSKQLVRATNTWAR